MFRDAVLIYCKNHGELAYDVGKMRVFLILEHVWHYSVIFTNTRTQ